MEFLGDAGNSSAVDVISFVREVVEKFPKLRGQITGRLLETFGGIKSGKVFRGALWIIGEYCAESDGKPSTLCHTVMPSSSSRVCLELQTSSTPSRKYER